MVHIYVYAAEFLAIELFY